jgi:amino acid transporter
MTSWLNLITSGHYGNTYHWIYLTYLFIMIGAGLINLFKVSITAALNAFSAWWHMIGVLVIVVILGVVPDHHRSFSYVFGQTINNTGFGGQSWTHGVFIYVFLTGLLMAQYTITGYDASAHMSEETRQASRGAAWGMVMSVVVSVVFGFILLVAMTFVIPNDKDAAAAGGGIVTYIWQTSMSTRWAEFLLFIAVLAQTFCTIASVTSASRMMFAFSRDGAVPGHRLWKRVSKVDRIPVYTVWAITVLAFLTPLPAWWFGYTGYFASTAIAVIGLYIAFMLPIILRLRAGEKFERGAWHLGRHYKWIDSIAIVWIIFICIVFILPFNYLGVPWNKGFDWNYFNYTPIPVALAFVLFGGWYVQSARRWFKGPIRQGDEAELERIESEFGERAAPSPAPAA